MPSNRIWVLNYPNDIMTYKKCLPVASSNLVMLIYIQTFAVLTKISTYQSNPIGIVNDKLGLKLFPCGTKVLNPPF